MIVLIAGTSALFFSVRKDRRHPINSTASVIRLFDRLSDPATRVNSNLRITAGEFSQLKSEGWEVSGQSIRAVSRKTTVSLPDTVGVSSDSLVVRFRGRAIAAGESLEMRVGAGKAASKPIRLLAEWKDYEVRIPLSDAGSIKSIRFVFKDVEENPRRGIAEFAFFEWPAYLWTRRKCGEDTRDLLLVAARSTTEFHVRLPLGSPKLSFTVGSCQEMATPGPIRVSVAIQDETGGRRNLLEEDIRPGQPGARWKELAVDLSEYEGRNVQLELGAVPSNGGSGQMIAWSSPEIVSASERSYVQNVILISIDTLRRDRLSCYGYPLQLTPNLDALAKKSLVFTNAHCTFPSTLPSHSSVFTGKLVSDHHVGLQDQTVPRLSRLPDFLETIAELAYKQGLVTAAITDGGFVSSFYGMDQGFQVFHENSRVEKHQSVATIDQALEWLSTHSARPFFLFLHSFKVHEPFNPPLEAYLKLFPGEGLTRSPKIGLEWLKDVVSGRVIPTAEEKRTVARSYDAGVYFFDQQLARLFAELDRSGLADKTAIIIFGDHGEQLFERGDSAFGHAHTLNPEEIHVPLLVYLPGHSHREIKATASLADIYPTIAQLIGQPIPRTAGQWNAISLLEPEDSALRKDRLVFYEVTDSRIAVWGAQNQDWKLVVDQQGRQSLFNLRNDPQEHQALVNIPDSPELRSLRAALKEYVSRSRQPVLNGAAEGSREMDPDVRKRLKELGYVD